MKTMKKELLEILGKIIDVIGKKGVKCIVPLVSIIILTFTFVSPSYIFMFFFKRNFFLRYDVSFIAMIILILDSILFLLLFVIHSLFYIKTDNYGKIKGSSTVLKDIMVTIGLMGVISIWLIICYIYNNKDNNSISIGVIELKRILIIICAYYILRWGYNIIKSGYINANNEGEEVESMKNYNGFDKEVNKIKFSSLSGKEIGSYEFNNKQLKYLSDYKRIILDKETYSVLDIIFDYEENEIKVILAE